MKHLAPALSVLLSLSAFCYAGERTPQEWAAGLLSEDFDTQRKFEQELTKHLEAHPDQTLPLLLAHADALSALSRRDGFYSSRIRPKPELVATLGERLSAAKPEVRAQAALALGLLGYRARSQGAGILKLCADPKPEVRERALWALGRVGDRDDARVHAALIKALGDEAPGVRAAAGFAVASLGSMFSKGLRVAVRTAMSDAVADVRLGATRALSRLGPGKADLGLLNERSSKEPSAPVRLELIRIFRELGWARSASHKAFLRGLQDESLKVRCESARGVAGLILRRPGREGAFGVGGGRRGGFSVEAWNAELAKVLLAALKDSAPEVRRATAEAIGGSAHLYPLAEATLTALDDGLEDADASVRTACALALGKARSQAATSVGALVGALEDKDPEVRAAAARALGSIGRAAHETVPRLQKLLKDPSAKVRWGAATGLGEMGIAARPARAALIEATRDSDGRVRYFALDALAKLKLQPDELMDTIRRALADSNKSARMQGCTLAESFGPKAAPVVPELVKLLRHPDYELQLPAIRALSEIGSKAEPAIPDLVRLLGSDLSLVRDQAREALVGFGKAALPALEAATASENADQRAAVAEAIEEIEGGK